MGIDVCGWRKRWELDGERSTEMVNKDTPRKSVLMLQRSGYSSALISPINVTQCLIYAGASAAVSRCGSCP